ncbi:AAA family ATPase [Candidatus Methylacidiphilum infernorum]|uniref:AAA family ATPase n=1 Tax=Candidatus Methylacidiphilum infernorum TaxID=511746 RepID=A0ABX7PT02_9BACT|nr:AAA family ATPase [Candidatus Methylacidiphilum infernorum]QSR86092.1 AAA family ATPase [Candidatus Methylacidiphilum infernorum]
MPSELIGKPVSSPASTGGAGTFFEQHVAAYWLALLLVRGIPPIFQDCFVEEVHLQTKRLGWDTDDFLVVGQTDSGKLRKIVGQVKRTFTVAADVKCKKAIQDFWRDFKKSDLFSPDTDCLVLVTQRGTNALLGDFSNLLICARESRDASDFEHRLAAQVSKKAAQYCEVIRNIIGEVERRSMSAAELRPFLRVLNVLSLDLFNETRQTESQIKTLLAYSADGALEDAEATWNELLYEASQGMGSGRSFKYEDLPEKLRQRHSSIRREEERVLQALKDHSALILDGIHSTIGKDLHLDRVGVVNQVIKQLESNQVILISGPAGIGKSVIAKDVVSILGHDHFTFAFRAAEFACAHLDETLEKMQLNGKKLKAILASQPRKVILVESVERLLEKSTRDAFNDLLTFVAQDKSWWLLLTCRDYSTDTVRSAFLKQPNLDHSVVKVSPLDDEELGKVKAACPALAYPLENQALRELLRNPFFLDKALQINWSAERELPRSERDLRALFWREIVRSEDRSIDGMPRQRSDAFVKIALRRAQTLSSHADCGDLDPKVLDALLKDSLIVSDPKNDKFIAPAHDVLEDWAILHWIEEQYLGHRDSIQDFAKAIGTYSAIRRAYRKWVTELVQLSPTRVDELFQDAVSNRDLPEYFRDDTLVSLLRSPYAINFLERHSERLWENNKQLLRRLIRLLRVGCVTAPDRLKEHVPLALCFNIPDGPAWGCILKLIQEHLNLFSSEDRLLLLGLIEDWAQGVTKENPYPDGAESVAAIAYWLLKGFYRSIEERKRTLRVLAMIPNADQERFIALLRGSYTDGDRGLLSKELREIIFEDFEGTPVARDMPELFVSIAKDYLLSSETDINRELSYSVDSCLETVFGIKPQRRDGFFPASAYRGPFLSLLRDHHEKGIDLIIDVFNYSAERYAERYARVSFNIEPLSEMLLTFPDGTIRKQWCNAGLWNLYRGTSVGPYVLQSLLMALERWLLEFAEAHPDEIDEILLSILERSASAALTAVVASIATAYPDKCGKTLLVLLSSRECILLDHGRLVNDLVKSLAPSLIADSLPQLNAINKVYEQERKEADSLPHRKRDLVHAVLSLQLGPMASQVLRVLDELRSALPPIEEQNEEDRIWRLALHRMDLRNYRVDKGEIKGLASLGEITSSEEVGRQCIRLDLKEPEPDLKEVVDQNIAQMESMDVRTDLLMWGLKIFRHEEDDNNDPAQWRQKLQQARSTAVEDDGDGDYDLGRCGPGFVAAVCIRDHWNEMLDEERSWCVDVVCSEIERGSEKWDQFTFGRENIFSADRPCAWVLPLLFGKDLNPAQKDRVRRAFVIALSHPVDDVRWYAALGIGRHLWTIDRDLTLRCVNALATEATLVQEAYESERSKTNAGRKGLNEILKDTAAFIRQRFFEADGIASHAYAQMDTSSRFGAMANKCILAILGQAPTEPEAIAAFERLALTFVKWWDLDDDRCQDREKERNLFAEFLLRIPADKALNIIRPIIDAIDSHPDRVSEILLELIAAGGRQPNTPKKVDELFKNLPRSSIVLNSYIKFLYYLGKESLPQAFVHIENCLRQGDQQKMLKEKGTISLLEVLLQRYVYGRPLELKSKGDLKVAVLFLLDLLVDFGSSASFRMRDDFVTPVPATSLSHL